MLAGGRRKRSLVTPLASRAAISFYCMTRDIVAVSLALACNEAGNEKRERIKWCLMRVGCLTQRFKNLGLKKEPTAREFPAV